MRGTARRVAWIGLVLALPACASTKVSDREVVESGRLARPDHIWVYDFAASPAEVPADSSLAGHYDPQSQPSAEELARGRELGAEVARALAQELQALGLPAGHASARTPVAVDDIVIRGYFASIHEGSAAERMTIGFGAGASKLTTVVEGFQRTPQGLRKLGSGSVSAGGGKTPGAAAGAAVALATANPIGLIVSSAVKVGGEVTGSSTIEGRGRQTAREIVEQMKPRLRREGWIE